jgi:large subunit ribosomal protein L29
VKAKQYREMSEDELQSTLGELQRRLFDLRSQSVTEKLENSKAIINTRRDVARVKTLLRERAIQANPVGVQSEASEVRQVRQAADEDRRA